MVEGWFEWGNQPFKNKVFNCVTCDSYAEERRVYIVFALLLII
jgi:hypothetical protein